MKNLFLILTITVALVSIGCSDANIVSNAEAVAETAPVANMTVAAESGQQEQDGTPAKSKTKSLLDFANKVLEEQAESGSEGAQKAKEWMSDKFGDATDSGSQIADDAAEWATDAFQSLKDKGLTSADNASQWLTEDIRNMNALKYKVVKVPMDDLEALEQRLNDLGKLRWDCFHAVEKDGSTVLFFKKERRSILKKHSSQRYVEAGSIDGRRRITLLRKQIRSVGTRCSAPSFLIFVTAVLPCMRKFWGIVL